MNNSKRIIRFIPDPPEAGYEAYLYLITIRKKLQKEKYYGGWHLGQYVLDPYQFSSEDEELLTDYATADKVEYRIMEYGTAYDMAYKERIMLDQADGEIGAAKSPIWYNKTNGGGKYSVGYTGEKQVNLIEKKLKEGEYEKGKSSKREIELMLDSTKTDQLQVRFLQFDPKYVNLYMDAFDEDPNPDNFPDLILLMPKKGSNEFSRIVGGNQTGRGCMNSKHGIGMNHIEIPYSDWSKLGTSDLLRLGNRLNPRDELERKRQTEEDAVKWIMDHCKEYNLTRRDSKMKVVWDIHHASISKELLLQGWKKRQLPTIFSLAQTLFENEIAADDNIIGWSMASLKLDEKRFDTYMDRKSELLKENGGEFDWVYKTSVDIGYHKVLEEIERLGFKKKGLVQFYFKNKKHESDYMNNIITNKYNVEFGAVRWGKWQTEFLSEYDITTEYLPVTRKQAKANGWFDGSKKKIAA